MRGGCGASSTIVPARFDRRTTSPHVALPLGQRVTGTNPHGAMAPRQHGQLAQLRPVCLLALPTNVASVPRFSGWSRVYFLLRLTVFFFATFHLGARPRVKNFPIALIGPRCLGHCASNPAYALPFTAKSYTDKTGIYSAASIIDTYNAVAPSIALRHGHANRNARPRSKYNSGI